MKFDMNAAWRDASNLLQANKELLLVLAGLFFFLPNLAFALFVPDFQQSMNGMQPEEMMAVLQDIYSRNWHWILFATVLQWIGILAMLALLRSAQKPTVADALTAGAIALVPYVLAQLIVMVGIGLAIGIPLGLASATGIGALVFLLAMLAIPAMIYAIVKFSMVAPILAIDRQLNPLAALKQSWSLTKGNSLRIFLFFLLVLIAVFVVSLIFSLLGMLLGSITGSPAVEGALTSFVGAAYTTVFTAVLAATYRQLSGRGEAKVSETFE